MADEHLQHLMKLIEAKQVYTSYSLLKKIPADTYIPGKQKIIDELKAALIKGKAIHAILQNSRNNGDYPTAYKQSLKLQQIVPDYPNLKNDTIAIEKALKNLDSTIYKAKIAASHGRKDEVRILLQAIRKIDAKHPEITSIEKTVRRRARGKSAKSIIASTLIIVIPCLLFGFEKIMIWQGEENLNAASRAISAGKFKQATLNIEQMHENLRFVYIFNNIKKDSLYTRAATMQSSLTYVQGMRGRVIHDGEFMSEQQKNIINKLERLLIDAATLTEKKQWLDALNIYNEALAFILRHEAQIGSEQAIILEKIAALEVKQEEQAKQLASEECLAIIGLANKAHDEKNWAQAIEKYNEAFTHASRFNVKATCIDTQGTAKYNATVLTILLQKADTLRSANKPSEAVDYYLQAIDHATASSMAQATIDDIQSRIDALKEQVFMARVHQLIAEGDTLIKQGDFAAGLSKYNFALTLLESNTERIQGKPRLSATLSQKINQTEKTAAITAHTADLKTFAQAGLQKHFALPPQAQLSKVTITLIEKQDNLFTYRISATDLRDKINYELLYQFDENTGTWNIIENKMN